MSSSTPATSNTAPAEANVIDVDAQGVYIFPRLHSFTKALLHDRAVSLNHCLLQAARNFGIGNVGQAGSVLTPILADVYDSYRLRQLMSPFSIVVPLDIKTQRVLAIIFCSLRFLGNCDSGGHCNAL
ncbi:hypothetical protein EST38_g12797 [Candolleomyces aberdarensis]|uniref:Uncharacterized protein n=1 Tax=Candolleomyces aberdarensis TaxID=2316362 RepID=A0A4Q2D2A8_9AGAR|nr:hypothetical protein EST38_g12797 [Candolleomyces aberdarensis]